MLDQLGLESKMRVLAWFAWLGVLGSIISSLGLLTGLPLVSLLLSDYSRENFGCAIGVIMILVTPVLLILYIILVNRNRSSGSFLWFLCEILLRLQLFAKLLILFNFCYDGCLFFRKCSEGGFCGEEQAFVFFTDLEEYTPMSSTDCIWVPLAYPSVQEVSISSTSLPLFSSSSPAFSTMLWSDAS